MIFINLKIIACRRLKIAQKIVRLPLFYRRIKEKNSDGPTFNLYQRIEHIDYLCEPIETPE